jgi:hypothetical protein
MPATAIAASASTNGRQRARAHVGVMPTVYRRTRSASARDVNFSRTDTDRYRREC